MIRSRVLLRRSASAMAAGRTVGSSLGANTAFTANAVSVPPSCIQRFANGQPLAVTVHRFSTEPALKSADSGTGARNELPTRHSRKQKPRTCTDAKELERLTDAFLKADPGSLFTYDSGDGSPNASLQEITQADRTNASEHAWNAAEESVQLAEYILRGLASHIPGTVDHRAASKDIVKSPLPPLILVQLMNGVIDRLRQEGNDYMELRQARLVRQAKENALHRPLENSTANPSIGIPPPANTSSSDQPAEGSSGDDPDGGTPQIANYRDTTQDIAPPGVTTACYDILLDAMAAVTVHSPDEVDWTPDDLQTILDRIRRAHELDGGDKNNTNPYTVPTMQSYNAVLRAIALMPSIHFDADEQMRDQAMINSLQIFQQLELTDTHRIQRNAATFKYMLQIIASILPPCRTRGNVSVSMFFKASQAGVVDRGVVDAFQDVHAESNGEEFQQYVEERKTYNGMPTKWIRRAKGLRHGVDY